MNSIADGTTLQAMMATLAQQPAVHGLVSQPAQLQELQGRLLNQAGFGVCVVNAGLELIYANQRGEQCFCDSYFPGRSRFVAGNDPVESRRVRAALLDALAGHSQMLEIEAAGARAMVAFSPIELAQGRIGAVVTLVRTESVPEPVLQAYARLVRLTRRETAVVTALARGADPAEAAEQLGIAVETVRTHIRAILNKAQAGNMRELLVRISRLPPMMPVEKSKNPVEFTPARPSRLTTSGPIRAVVKVNAKAAAAQLSFCGGLENLARGQMR